ncbi:metalloproteinase inhibitor 2-like [Mercenaria mercenaria]|uniref:metalloproteinase inhibitor 2-like n=1 Tax=Mercenaria mercenaria TaxID=6596 RepID=UPI00234F2A19|nr:metalloproteinase inhibitor 2-like [Mercenaria mercenaria]
MQLLILFVLLTITGLSSACSCIDTSVHEKYCKADFAVLVKVLNNGRVSGMNRIYRIKLEATYRSNVYGSVDKRQIFTATNSAACGVILQRGYYYILTGYYRTIDGARRMKTGLCDIQQRFDRNPKRFYRPPNCNGIYFPNRMST